MSKKKNLLKKRRRELPPITEKFFRSFNKQRQKCNVTWDEFFERLHNYEDWVEHLLTLPKEPSETDKINAVTVTYLLPIWLEQIYQNFIKDNVHVPALGELRNTKSGIPGLVIANGPWLHDNNNLELLRDSAFYRNKKGLIVSTAHTLKDCINVGVVPDYIVLMDESEIEVDFIDVDDKYTENITGIFAPSIHPEVLKRWKGKKYFYIGVIPHRTIPNVQLVLASLLPFLTEFDAGGNCGNGCWSVARYIGCNPIGLLGLDFSFKPDTPVSETPYYSAFRRSYKSDEEMLKKAYRFHTHSFFKNNSYTDANFDDFCKVAVAMFKRAKKDGVETINCSPGIIDSPDIPNMWFKDFLGKWEKE